MNFEEHVGKSMISAHGIAVPIGQIAHSAEEAAAAARQIGACVVKAQVATGKRGKAGGIKLAATPEEAKAHAANILSMTIDDWPVHNVLVEEQSPIARELYAAIVIDPVNKSPMVLFSTLGGMDVEEAAVRDPNAMRRMALSMSAGLDEHQATTFLNGLDLSGLDNVIGATLVALYCAFRALDAELLEVNPLVITQDRRVVALDCKLTVDDAAVYRQPDAAVLATPDRSTDLERKAADAGLKYIELGGSVGVLANGAGLTMTTMDVIAHYGGSPANFLEIGGEAYTKSHTALSILLENKRIKSLLVNFCGAFARTDVMAEGVVAAWEDLKPDIPIFFTIHGTGEEEAISLVQNRLGITPFNLMDDAVKAAVRAAAEGGTV
ncbi:MAG: succinate--CoA ligase subunit beta [Hyphomicrobiaceae bacterium]